MWELTPILLNLSCSLLDGSKEFSMLPCCHLVIGLDSRQYKEKLGTPLHLALSLCCSKHIVLYRSTPGLQQSIITWFFLDWRSGCGPLCLQSSRWPAALTWLPILETCDRTMSRMLLMRHQTYSSCYSHLHVCSASPKHLLSWCTSHVGPLKVDGSAEESVVNANEAGNWLLLALIAV